MNKLLLNKLMTLTLCAGVFLGGKGFAEEESKEEDRSVGGPRHVSIQQMVDARETRLQKQLDGEEQSDVPEEATITEVKMDLDEERTGDQPALKSMSKTLLYFTSHPGVFYSAVFVPAGGDFIDLHDGSRWMISFWDRHKVIKWFTTDQIIITQNPNFFSLYAYEMVNLQTGDKVNVNLKEKPYFNGFYTRHLIGADLVFNQVVLSDGSVWLVDIWDAGVLASWFLTDRIILGINEENCCNACPPNILINAETSGFVRATCLN